MKKGPLFRFFDVLISSREQISLLKHFNPFFQVNMQNLQPALFQAKPIKPKLQPKTWPCKPNDPINPALVIQKCWCNISFTFTQPILIPDKTDLRNECRLYCDLNFQELQESSIK